MGSLAPKAASSLITAIAFHTKGRTPVYTQPAPTHTHIHIHNQTYIPICINMQTHINAPKQLCCSCCVYWGSSDHLEASWGHLITSWSYLGTTLKPLGESWGRPEDILGPLAAMLEPLVVILGQSWTHLGAILGPLEAILEPQSGHNIASEVPNPR